MNRYKLGWICILVLAVTPLLATTPFDWPCFRGPHGNGISLETDWNPKALEGRPKILWEANIGRGHSGTSIQDGRLYTMGERQMVAGQDTAYEEIIYCFDANTGREIWRYGYPHETVQWPGPAATPAVDQGRVYTIGRQGLILCFDAVTGRVIWRRDMIRDSLATYTGWGFCASPVIEGDLLLLNAGKSGLALDKKTGKTIWSSEKGAGWVSTPLVYEDNGKREVAFNTDRNLEAVESKSGKLLWSHGWTSDADPYQLAGQLLLMGGHGRFGSALLNHKEGTPEVVWQNRNGLHSFQSPVIIGNHVYGFGYVRQIQPFLCMELESGEVKWTEVMSTSRQFGSVMAAGDKLIILTDDGNLVIAQASPDGLETISQAKLFQLQPFNSYPDGDPNVCWTAPVLADGKIYARTTYGELVCVDVRK